MRDVQSEKDNRGIPLKKVGIKNITWPIKVITMDKKFQSTVANIDISVDLKDDIRGTHMSRFIEVLNEIDVLNPDKLMDVLKNVKNRLKANNSHIKLSFPYFVYKKTPVSRISVPGKIECVIEAELNKKMDMIIGVKVPIHTLCPCSKEISDFGAHNQRAIAEIYVRSQKIIWFEELVELAEKSASSPIYPLLKRSDEKYVTEYAYQNPKFVEDVVRDIVIELEKDKRVIWYKVEVTSFESIHNHEAFACVEREWVKK